MYSVRPLILVAFGALTGAGAIPSLAQVTEIYKCTDKGGRPLYTSDKKDMDGKKCELVSREVNVVPAQKPLPAPRAGGFPRESPSDRAFAKGRQRSILEQELTTEEGLLKRWPSRKRFATAMSATTPGCSSGCSPIKTTSTSTRKT